MKISRFICTRPPQVLQRWCMNRELPGPAIRIISACSGLGTECFAMHRLKRKFRLVSSSDVSPAMAAFCVANHEAEHFFRDCCSEQWRACAPMADLLVAGFPCQPFSVAGRNQGERDQRTQVIWSLLHYVKSRLPKAIVLENVKGLLTRHATTLLEILDALLEMEEDGGAKAYTLRWKILNSADHGLPQQRQRLYVVAIRRKFVKASFRWPSPAPAKKLEPLLEAVPRRMTKSALRAARPAGRAGVRTDKVIAQLKMQGIDPATRCIAIDCDASKAHWREDRLPCLTASRGYTGGFWLTNRGRKTTSLELMRCQGFASSAMDTSVLSEPQMGRALGNAMSLPVVEGVLRSVLASVSFD